MIPNDNFSLSQDSLNISKQPKLKQTRELKSWAVIEDIRKHPNSNSYQIGKRTKINKSQIFSILRELVFSRVVCVKPGVDIYGRPCELFFLPEELNKEVENGRQ